MARDLSFLKMPEKSQDDAMIDEGVGDMNGMNEPGSVLADVTDEELVREVKARGLVDEEGKLADMGKGVEDSEEMPEPEEKESEEEAEEEE